MTYHPLSSDSGQSPERRVEEARALVSYLADYLEELKPHEREFVEKMEGSLNSLCSSECSVKQLFWLRDLWGRFA